MLFRRPAVLLFLFLLTVPLVRAHSGHEIVLGEYYYPKGGNAWIPRGDKTEFSKGDFIIVKDSRVTIGGGGEIPYSLNHKDVNIDRGTIRLNPGEFPVALVTGGNPHGNEAPEQWALVVPIDVNTGIISSTFTWFDVDARGSGGALTIIETKFNTNLATIVPRVGDDLLTIAATTDVVLAENNFTLTGNLDAVSYIFEQGTSQALVGKATVVSPTAGISVQQATGAVTLTSGKSITFKAPPISGSNPQGTISFGVRAQLAGGKTSNTVTKNIIVIRPGGVPGGNSAVGTPLGTPSVGNSKPATAVFAEGNVSQVLVNTKFSLVAFGKDEDGTLSDANPDIGGSVPTMVITGKWERVLTPTLLQPLTSERAESPEGAGVSKEFPVEITESVPAVYTYRFTVKDAKGYGNYYQTQVAVVSSVAPPGPSVRLASEPASADPEATVVLDATSSTGQGSLQFTWVLQMEGADVPYFGISPGKISFKVPLSAVGKKLSVTVSIKDTEDKTATKSFDINISPGPFVRVAAEPPGSAEADNTVAIDASQSIGQDLQYAWTVRVDGTDLAFTTPSSGRMSFKVPVSAATKKIIVTLTLKDSSNRQSVRTFEVNVPALSFKSLALAQVRGLSTRPPKGASGGDDPYAAGNDFINYVAILNPNGEAGRVDSLSIKALDRDGVVLSEVSRSVDLGLGAVPYARQIEKMIPEEVAAESESVKVSALTRLAGMGMVIDTASPRMDAFDLVAKSGTDWVVPYSFRGSREKFGIISVQNSSNEDAEVQPTFFTRNSNLEVKRPKFTLKAGGTRVVEVVDLFDLRQFNDPAGYFAISATKGVQVNALFGDNLEMFSVPGVRKEDYAPTLAGPAALRTPEWETTVSLINPDVVDRVVRVQIANTASDFPASLSGKQYSWTLKPGVNEMTLGEMFGNVQIPFTALRFSGVAGTYTGSMLLKNSITGAESLWQLVDSTVSKMIFPHVVLGGDWQASFAVSNLASTPALLKSSAVLLIQEGTVLKKKAFQGTFTLAAGATLASSDLNRFGINVTGGVFGGYLLIQAQDAETQVDLVGAGLMFHANGRGGIDALSVVPAVQ